MIKDRLYLLIILIAMSGSLFAQNSYHKWGIEVNGGFQEYQGDLGSALFFAKGATYQGAGGSISRYINSSFDLVLSGNFGDVGFRATVEPLPPPFKFKGFTANIGTAQVGVRYKLANGSLLSEDAMIQPYLMGSWGAFYVHSRALNVQPRLSRK